MKAKSFWPAFLKIFKKTTLEEKWMARVKLLKNIKLLLRII